MEFSQKYCRIETEDVRWVGCYRTARIFWILGKRCSYWPIFLIHCRWCCSDTLETVSGDAIIFISRSRKSWCVWRYMFFQCGNGWTDKAIVSNFKAEKNRRIQSAQSTAQQPSTKHLNLISLCHFHWKANGKKDQNTLSAVHGMSQLCSVLTRFHLFIQSAKCWSNWMEANSLNEKFRSK